MGISEKNRTFFPNQQLWRNFLECVLKGIIASENWESSKFGAFWKITWFWSRKYVILFSIAIPSNFFEQCVSNGTSVSKISQMFKFWICWKRRWFFGNKTLIVFKNRQLRQTFSGMYLDLYYCSRVLKTLKNVFFSEKNGPLNRIIASFQKQ